MPFPLKYSVRYPRNLIGTQFEISDGGLEFLAYNLDMFYQGWPTCGTPVTSVTGSLCGWHTADQGGCREYSIRSNEEWKAEDQLGQGAQGRDQKPEQHIKQ